MGGPSSPEGVQTYIKILKNRVYFKRLWLKYTPANLYYGLRLVFLNLLTGLTNKHYHHMVINKSYKTVQTKTHEKCKVRQHYITNGLNPEGELPGTVTQLV